MSSSSSINNNNDDDMSEGERDVGVLNSIKANYIEKIIVSARLPEVLPETSGSTHSQHHVTPKTLNLVPQLSRVPLYVENNRPASSSAVSHPPGSSHNNTASNGHQSLANPTTELGPDGKPIRRNSPPRPPTSSTPSRVGTASRPKTSSRVISSSSNQPQLSMSQTAPATSTGETAKPTTALTNVSPVKHTNIENRILIRLANMLPTETDSPANDRSPSPPPHQHGNNHTDPAHQSHQSHHHHHSHGNNSHFSKLPESRNMLLRLNHDLDEMMTDIRNWGLELDRFNFGDMQSDGVRSKDYTAGPSMDNNPLVFDQVIAELSGQASKKVVRLKKMYRNQMQKLKKQYDKHVAELKVQADTLSSRLFASQLRGDNFSDALNTPGGENTTSSAAAENDSLQQHQRIVKALREEQDSMQEVLLQRLENERKMSLDKFIQLDVQLKDTQRELADAKAQIAQLSSQLLERQNTQLDKDRNAVMDLTEQLKELIKVSQATVPTK